MVSFCISYSGSGFVAVFSSLLGTAPLEVLHWYRVILVVEIKGSLVFVSDHDVSFAFVGWKCDLLDVFDRSWAVLFCSGLRDVSGCGTIGEYETAPVYISNNKQHA